MNEKIMVSISCTVYNHEKYLRQCLDGFIMQKTNFKFEVLVHDDASTDGSADIIREYENKYPEIIKPIYQKENQYSQGIKIVWKYQYPRAKGKYIAICEGDDFWINPYKLQKQFDIMEKYDEVSLCVHNVRYVNESGEPTDKFKPNPVGYEKMVNSCDSLKGLLLNNLVPYQTSSYFFRICFIKKIIDNIPLFISKCPVGDVAYLLYFSYCGNIYYLPYEMSCYRMFSVGSWTSRNSNNDRQVIHKRKLIATLNYFNSFTRNEYDYEIKESINKLEFDILRLEDNFDLILKDPYKKMLYDLPKRERKYIIIRAKFPLLYKLYDKIKHIFVGEINK